MDNVRGFIDSRDIVADPVALRQRAQEEGYLFIKGLLPRELILELRRQILQKCQSIGLLADGSELLDGVCDLMAVTNYYDNGDIQRGVGLTLEHYREIQKLELFHSIPHHPNVIGLYRNLLGDRVLPHPRNIARIMLPDPRLAPTPPHQDFIHIQGTEKVWTCWIPLGDVPRTLGGLSMLRGSHKDGLLPVKEAAGAGGLETWLCNNEHEWLEDDYEAGDVITFPSYTVHKALQNREPGKIRLSCDYRFQQSFENIEAKSLLPHYDVASWEDLYDGWENEQIQYYWENEQLTFSEWDESIRWQKVDIC